MITLFLLFSSFFALLAYNIEHPHYTNPRLAIVSFMAGWLTGELALHHILLQASIVLFFVLMGAVWGLHGVIGLGLCFYAWSNMANFYYNGYKARDEVEAALKAGLGFDYQNSIDPNVIAQFAERPDASLLRRPLTRTDPDVELIKDIPFGDFGQALDIRRSKISAQCQPVLLQIHGGGWTEKMGSKNEQALPLMNHMAKRGWICVAVSYRLSPTATFPDHIIDCKQAIVWIKDKIAEYGGDPDFIVVTGGSAGGHLSSLVALTPNDPGFQPGFEDQDTTVQGAVPFYGSFDMTDSRQRCHNDGLLEILETSVMKMSLRGHEVQFDNISPLKRIHPDAPPFMVVHGDKDTLVPVEMSRDFVAELSTVSENPAVYAEISGGQHAFDILPSIRSEFVKFGVERFLGWVYANKN